MRASGVLSEILPGTISPDRLAASVHLAAEAGLPADPMQRLMSLLCLDEGVAASIADAFRMSNAERARMEACVKARAGIGERTLAEGALRRAFYQLGEQAVLDYLFWRSAGENDLNTEYLVEAAQMADTWQRPRFSITGDDALAAGLKGVAIGEALRQIETDWVESDFTSSRDDMLNSCRLWLKSSCGRAQHSLGDC